MKEKIFLNSCFFVANKLNVFFFKIYLYKTNPFSTDYINVQYNPISRETCIIFKTQLGNQV